MRIRPATLKDFQAISALYATVGWVKLAEEVQFCFRNPEIIPYVAEDAGTVIGTGAAVHYADTGWLALIAVEPGWQGRGVGRALVEWGLSELETRNPRGIVLLASTAGRRLYEKMGFRSGIEYVAYVGRGVSVNEAGTSATRRMRSVHPLTSTDWPQIATLDRRATGEERAAMLKAVQHGSHDGYCVKDQDGRLSGFYIVAPWGGGPAITTDPTSGRLLVDLARMVQGKKAMRIRVPESNEAAKRYVRELGFRELLRCTYMVKGAWPEPYRPGWIWGMFNFAFG